MKKHLHIKNSGIQTKKEKKVHLCIKIQFMFKFLRSEKPNDWSDEQLLDKYVGKGEAYYLGILYERYMPMVYGVCLKILKDTGKSEDAVMNIYEELTQKVKEHKIEAFRGWLYVLARNHCLMEWRKMQRKPTTHVAPEDMTQFDAVEDAFEIEFANGPSALQKCLQSLADFQRQCVQLFYYEDKTYKEIAEFLKIEIGATRSFIQNGRRNLKICLEG
jgi:RNA polymerase sigma factor (sigma-70 family)